MDLNRILRPLADRMPRMRPSLIVIGAQKAGTTTLFDLLAQHPRIIPPAIKEISFFGDDEAYGAGMERYRAHFPRTPVSLRRCITFEASPAYFFKPKAAERIARHLPHARCLVVLRDPVSRAFSAWNMYRMFKDHPRHGRLHDPRSFEQAVEDELAGKPEMDARKYIANSTYAPQLERYLRHVGKERLLVHGFKELKKDPVGMVNSILERMDLEPMPRDHPAFRTHANARSYSEPIDGAIAASLYDRFAADLVAVQQLIGRPIDILEDRASAQRS